MRKIPTVFVRDFSKRSPLVTPEVTPGCEWVLEGEGIATRQWDGTCVLIRDGKMYARYDCKNGKAPPEGFEACEEAPDPTTGHWPGWILVEEQPQYKWHRQAFEWHMKNDDKLEDGTYELLGPKINGNPECTLGHTLIESNMSTYGVVASMALENDHMLFRHGWPGPLELSNGRSFEVLKCFFEKSILEGIVFHHEDGRMAKIKRSDFGFAWPVMR